MRYFLDTEFYESGPINPIRLISIALVDDYGREFYAENSEANLVDVNDWLKANVIPKLTGPKRTMAQIKQDILKFIGEYTPEFWGYFCDYDWVVFCQIFGCMVDLPPNFPMHCMDLKQEMKAKNLSREELPLEVGEHHALNDARWNRKVYKLLSTKHYP
jgi:hypothetical protein